ncbi:transposase [Pseudoduganella chitinolytica]|uniref:Transposase n=1 Tax=Pseudoduganella chitinolytica TaxID=34070 RepID=A0ABY8BLQ9_9BURK|nr:transposase [Pseudoduganella chitinolytica]WEF35229.1 transposase [Pseudoduganella chitinolytica]
MPRQPRLLLQGLPLHIIQRGHNRQACFLREADFLIYLAMLREHARRTECSIHAYVLMTNHVHMLASFADVHRLPELIRLVGQQYAQYLNRRRHSSGTVWDGRYRSSPVPSERYLLVCQRYIELNPVRARMVISPGDYRWSSYRGNAGLVHDALLTPHELYARLGEDTSQRAEGYRALFGEPLTEAQLEALRRAANSNHIVPAPLREDEGPGVCPSRD